MIRFAIGLAAAALLAGVVHSQKAGTASQEKPLKLPAGWNPADPVPFKKTNCVRCHLSAGRELTEPVRLLARSAHDLAHLSCNDCHGGNTADDSSAHEADHGFIGTKLSAHMAACSGCHARQAETFKKGKHYKDLAKGIDRKFPVCIDCHGNHDVGKPPSDFTLTSVCTDCHKRFAADLPQAATIADENDRLWAVLRKVHARNIKADDPDPAAYRAEINRARTMTAALIHRGGAIKPEEAEALNKRVARLRESLERWLKEQR
jgi:hypothetical protein